MDDDGRSLIHQYTPSGRERHARTQGRTNASDGGDVARAGWLEQELTADSA